MSELCIAIDFGSSNIKVSRVDLDTKRISEVTLGGHGEGAQIENSIFYENDQNYVLGNIGENQALVNNKSTSFVKGIKKFIGDREWSKYIENLSTEKNVTDVVTDILCTLRQTIEKKMGQQISHTILTTPVLFSEIQKNVLKKACKRAGLPLDGFLSEPIAGALGQDNEIDDFIDKYTMIFDFGGGTIDIVLLTAIENNDKITVEVLNSVGLNFGGNTINDIILDKIVKPHINQDILSEDIYMYKLLKEVETSKTNLLADEDEEEANIYIYGTQFNNKTPDVTIKILTEDIKKYVFETGLKEKITDMFDYLLDGEGLEKTDINKVIMLGGSSQIKFVQEIIDEYFDDEDIFDIDEVEDYDLYHSVAKGGATYLLSLLEDGFHIKLENRVPFELGAIKNSKFIKILGNTSSFEFEGVKRRFKSISTTPEEKEAVIAQRFKVFDSDSSDLEITIGKVKCNRKKYKDFVYYSFCIDKKGELTCKFFNDSDLIEETEIIVEE